MTIWNKARDLHRLASLLNRPRIFFKIRREMESSFSLLVCRSHRGLSGPSGAGGRLSSTGTMAPLSDGAGTTLRQTARLHNARRTSSARDKIRSQRRSKLLTTFTTPTEKKHITDGLVYVLNGQLRMKWTTQLSLNPT